MEKNKNTRVGIYLCVCEGKNVGKIDFEEVKKIIQSEAEFEYIRVADVLCGQIEKERLGQEIDKYSLNRLLIAGCSDPFITRQFVDVAQSKGMARFNIEFLDLSAVKGIDGAVAAINKALTKMQLRGDVGVEEVKVNPRVLVIGCGREAAAAALAIAMNQPVVMIDHGGSTEGIKQLKNQAQITVRCGAKIIGLSGFNGNFTVRLLENGKRLKEEFGAVVIATQAQPVFNSVCYGGLEPGERVLTLSQFDDKKVECKGKKFVFVLGKAEKDSFLSYSIALKKAIDLKEKGAAQVSIMYEDMKVSADRLEQEYEEARAKGVNFLKYVGDLELSSTLVAATVKYKEPFLSGLDPLCVNSDYLVLAEDYTPADTTAELAQVLEIRLGPDGYFQDDNVHYLPIKSNREGIFFIGSCHGPIHGVDLEREVATVAAECARFAKGSVVVTTLQPRVDETKCAVCLTCYRSCPHKAIEIVHDPGLNNMYHSAARMNPLACRRCGTCAGECPGKAIQLPFYSDQEILLDIAAPKTIVAYGCENSGFLASEFARELDPELQKNLQIVKVPCSGKIDALYLMKALERGADGVLLMVCHKDNCKFVWGNERAEKRCAQVRSLLKQVGIEEDRVDIVHVAANQGHQFNAAVKAMAERIQQLGTNPGKVRK